MTKSKLYVALFLLALGFIGVIFTELKQDGAWTYWEYVSFIYAIVSLTLSLYLRKQNMKSALFTIWHELAHWGGMVVVILMIAYYVKMGTISRYQAGLQALTLLAFSTYLLGIYIEPTFIFVGVSLGIFAFLTAFLTGYVYLIAIPVVLIAAALLYWNYKRNRRPPEVS